QRRQQAAAAGDPARHDLVDAVDDSNGQCRAVRAVCRHRGTQGGERLHRRAAHAGRLPLHPALLHPRGDARRDQAMRPRQPGRSKEMPTGRPTNRREFLKFAALGGATAILAACGPTPPSAGAPTTAPAAKPPEGAPKAPEQATAVPAVTGKKQKISISHIGGGSQAGSDQSARMKDLRAAFPDIEIENRWVSYAAYVDKISVMAATGDLADLQFCNAFNDVPLMMDNNLLLETGPLLDTHRKHILAATPKEAWASTSYDGNLYAVAHHTY